MRKSLKIGLAILPAVVGTVACLAACRGEHTHTFATDWSSDADFHWHTATCKHTEEIKDKAPHTFTDDFNETKHWQICSVCESKKDEAEHTFVNGVCGCGYVDPSARLIYTLSGNEYTVSVNQAALEDKTFTSLEIPKEYEGKQVRRIAENGFNGAKYLESITLPDSIRYIGDYAFQNCESLTGIELPGALQQLGNQTFNGCKSLTGTVTMPSAITVIGENLFLNCDKLTSIEFAAGTTRIGTQAFANCKALTAVAIPDTVNYIGLKAFKGTGLTDVTVPESVTTLFSYAFEDCTSLTNATILANIEYATGSWFGGCTALQTLTLPFVGQDIHPLEVSRTAFGFAFGTNAYGVTEGENANVAAVEQNGVTYYIPKSLTELTVLGGIVKAGAFDNCGMLQTVMLKDSVVMEAEEFVGCNAKFYIAPSLEDLEILNDGEPVNAADTKESLTLSYTKDSFSTVSVSVTKDGVAAESSDYVYDEENNTIVFNTAGTFEVTVTATSLNGKSVSRSVQIAITLAEPELSEITLDPAVAELTGGEGATAETTVSFTVDAESKVSVTVKQDGVAIENAYEEESKKVTLSAAGIYVIEVTAERNGYTVTRFATFIVRNSSAAVPEVSFTATNATVEEGSATTLTVNVGYGEGATKKDEKFDIFTKNGSNFENADPNDYEWNEDAKTFTPKVAGIYRIRLTVLTAEGASTQSDVTVTAIAANVELSIDGNLMTNGWIRLVSGSDQDIAYTVTGYAEAYDISYEADIEDATIGKASVGTAVTVSLNEPNTVIYKIVYTHKTADKKVELSIPVSFVSDLNAPVLGEDPFGGTYDGLIPSTGLMLYYDVTTDAVASEQIAAENVSFEVAATSDLKDGGTVSIETVNGQNYVVVNDNAYKANGKITLKMSATVDGKTVAAHKTFTVTAVGNNDTEITKYIKNVVKSEYAPSNMRFIGNDKIRQNMVVSQTGIVHYRNGGEALEKELLRLDVNAGIGTKTKQYRIDFKFTVLQDDNDMNLMVGFRTGNWDGWVGQLGYRPNYVQNGSDWVKTDKLEVQGWGLGDGSHETDASRLKSAAAGTVVYGRVERTISGSNVSYTAYWSDTENGDFAEVCKYTSSSGNAAKDTFAMQIGVSGSNGFYLENLKYTVLS